MVILKILPPLPNLTSNFKTHKNLGDNFYFVYNYIYASSKQSLKKFKGYFWYPVLIGKKANFWTSYWKTHVNMVISKMVLPKPQLDIKF